MIWQLLTAPLSGLLWIAEQVEERATDQLDQQQNLSKRLTKLQVQLDLGDISESEYELQEAEILALMEAEEEANPS
ncbi:MAG: gas vesicle protein GvpG [Oscillatoriales cyanobacterium SM2_2_1]|nr:gas vesicle protein GvpG [Oscillatoriales cyanobacterium SM2_2_1]